MKLHRSLLILIVLLMLLVVPRAYSIQERQDPDMPVGDTIVIGYNDLKDLLNDLKKLNDPIVNDFVDEINRALASGDYERAYRLLQELQQYLNRKYSGKALDPGIAKAVSSILAVKDISDKGVYIDASDLLEKYGELINNEDIIELARMLNQSASNLSPENLTQVSDIIHKILGSTTQVPSEVGGVGNEVNFSRLEIPGLGSEIPGKLPKISGLPSSIPGSPAIASPAFPSTNYMLLFISIPIVLLATIYLFRSRLKPTISLVNRFLLSRASKIFVKTYVGIMSKLGLYHRDPVISLYKSFITIASALGFKKRKNETPREFVQRINRDDVKRVGIDVTSVYEQRIYGKKVIDQEVVERLKKIIKEEWGV